MRVLSWNVNGLRSILKKKALQNVINEYSPDIVCLQEIKCSHQIAMVVFEEANIINEYPYVAVVDSTNQGYAGVLVLSKAPFNKVHTGVGHHGFDTEGRFVAVELGGIVLACVYSPNSKPKLERLAERTSEWEPALKKRLRVLKGKGKLLVLGDMNVAPEDIDIFSPNTHKKSPGFTCAERSCFRELLQDLNLTDTFRQLHPKTQRFTYWSYLGASRKTNKGWRLDLALAAFNVQASDILDDIMGSDHCPILITIQ